MALTIGLVGLPQSGKSTLFAALTARGSTERGDDRSRTGHPKGRARVPVPDERLWKLSEIFQPKKTTPATVDFLDVSVGTETPTERESGLGDRLIADIRAVDALAQVIRCFPHPYLEGIDSLGDLDELELELYLADLAVIEGRLERSKKMHAGEKELLEDLRERLSRNEPARPESLSEEQRKWLSGLALLHLKPRILVGNVPDDAPDGPPWRSLAEAAAARSVPALAIPAKVEAEIAELPAADQDLFLREMGIAERGLDRLIQASYRLLGLLTFFTVGEDEVRAWTVREKTRAQEAAGKIHSDLDRGFIRAEIIDYPRFMTCGSMAAAKDQGALRVEGKDYLVTDGEIMTVRFNV